MIRSLSEVERSQLEDELRSALQGRAASTSIAHGRTHLLTTRGPRPSRRRAQRRHVLVGGSVAAAVAIVAFAVAERDQTTVDINTVPAAPSKAGATGLPVAEVPRLLIGGATFLVSDGDVAAPVDHTAVLFQSFRRAGRLDGPMIFLTTLRPWDPETFGLLDDLTGDPIEVRGRVGYLGRQPGEQGQTVVTVELGDGNALYLNTIGISADEAVAFLDGLEAAPGGWQATALPPGLSELPVALAPADGRSYAATFDLPLTASVDPARDQCLCVDVTLYQDGFENRLGDRVSSTTVPIEMVNVDGVPASLGSYNDTDWWVMLEPEPGRALELRITGDRAVVEWVLSNARFVDEGTWDSATNG